MRFIIIGLIFFIGGCVANQPVPQTISTSGHGGDRTVKKQHVTQKTIRYSQKMEVGRALCQLQSNNHNNQRILISLPGAVFSHGKKDTPPMVVYNPNITPFNMIGCLAEIKRSKWESVISQGIDAGKSLLTLGVKGYAAYKVVQAVTDNNGVKIDGVESGANVGVGTDQAPVNIDNRAGANAGDGSIYNNPEEESEESTKEEESSESSTDMTDDQDTDTDGDGIADSIDNCPSISNSSQTDDDGDGLGNQCDTETVGDQ